MEKALTCVPSDRVTTDNVGDLFGLVCGLGKNVCAGINGNATTGSYGAYGMCDPLQQVGWALNAYYEQQVSAGNGASACAFSGSASTQAAHSPTGSCAALISQAGNGGTGTVTSAPSNTGGGSGSNGGGSSSSSKGAAPAAQASMPWLGWGALPMGVYVICAAVTGAGMIIL